MGKRLADKVAIVTGASSGQGAATARLFVAEGARVMLTDLNDPGAGMLESLGGDARFQRHDVSDLEAWREVVAATVKRFGRLNVLINNAGVYRPGHLKETDQSL